MKSVIKISFSPKKGLLAKLHVRGRLLGLLPHQARGGAWPHGLARHSVPRLDQYLQQCQVSISSIQPKSIPNFFVLV